MIRGIASKRYNTTVSFFLGLFFVFWILPLFVISLLAFNDADYIGFPFKGFTLDWFIGSGKRTGIFHNPDLLHAIVVSVKTATIVSAVSLIIATAAVLYFEKAKSRAKNILYYLAVSPLIIPGVILGIAILTFATAILYFLQDHASIDLTDYLSPGFWLVVIGQISFVTSYSMLIIQAQMKKFDKTWEEAALNLKASHFDILRQITIPFLRPALIKAFVAGFLISFSNFNTTVFLVGSDPTLPIYLFSQVKYNLTPVVNAVSFLIILFIAFFAVVNFIFKRD
ncbi:ABC transporter permease [Desulfurobacterium sp.]